MPSERAAAVGRHPSIERQSGGGAYGPERKSGRLTHLAWHACDGVGAHSAQHALKGLAQGTLCADRVAKDSTTAQRHQACRLCRAPCAHSICYCIPYALDL